MESSLDLPQSDIRAKQYSHDKPQQMSRLAKDTEASLNILVMTKQSVTLQPHVSKATKSQSVISHVLQTVISAVRCLFCINNHFILLKDQTEHAVSHRQRIFGELLKQILISQ